jgi:hypothetical protein
MEGGMTVRIPATLVALALVLVLNAGTFMLAGTFVFADVPRALLPLWAAAGGFVAGRWGAWPAPVPGFAVGLLVVATQIGLATGYRPELRAYIEPSLALLQISAAITGGMLGTLQARRASQPQARVEPEYTALS